MIPARRLAQPARNRFFRRLGSRDARYLSSSASQATNTTEGARPWWSSSALPAAMFVVGAGVIALSTNDEKQQDWNSKLSSILSTQVAQAEATNDDDDETTDVINWSGTHQVSVQNKNYFEPETVEEVEQMIQKSKIGTKMDMRTASKLNLLRCFKI